MDAQGTRPHTAVMNVILEVHSLLDDGQCSGQIVDDATLKQHGLQPRFILSVKGFDRHDCLVKLKEKLSTFKD